MEIPFQVMACPFCSSELGQRVSARLFASDFWVNVFLVASPILLLGMIVLSIHFALPVPQGGGSEDRQDRFENEPLVAALKGDRK